LDSESQKEKGRAKSLFTFLKKLLKGHYLENKADLDHEFQDLIREGRAKGFIDLEETKMLAGVLELKDTPAHAIMIPRTEMVTAPLNSSLEEIIKIVTECGHTRIPIYGETIDEIVGILHAKDLLKLWGSDPKKNIPHEILRRPLFVPENRNINDVLKELKNKKTHLAIVTDEYGGTSGIITIEDILEEIVGEIMDEHDLEPSLIERMEDGTIVVDAKLEIEKLEEYLGVRFPKGDFESVGGLILNRLGRIPKRGEEIVFDNIMFRIESSDERKINRVVVLPKKG